MFHDHLDCLQKPPLGGRPDTKVGDHGTSSAHNCWNILFYHAWGPTWMESHWNSIRLRPQSHMTSHYTWRSVTTRHDVGGVLGWPLDTFFWALTISWSRPWLVCEVALYNESSQTTVAHDLPVLRHLMYWSTLVLIHIISQVPVWTTIVHLL